MTTTEIQKHEDIKQWKYMHPMLGLYTYKNLPEPKTLSEAHCRMMMHKNSVEDIDIQIQIAEMNHSIFMSNYMSEMEDVDAQKYDTKQKKHMDKIVILLNSKLQHKRKANAYWYWLQCHDECMEEKINNQLSEVDDG